MCYSQNWNIYLQIAVTEEKKNSREKVHNIKSEIVIFTIFGKKNNELFCFNIHLKHKKNSTALFRKIII